jgi:leucyl aminopeptidase
MHEMKIDMAGAATCLGVIAAAKALQLPLRIVAILPTTENLPGGEAIKPGDIVTAYDGKTIEILNTDAEGRVILADGLAYAAKDIQPDAVIDVATLTGAAIVAFGHEITPLFGNNEQLFSKIEAAAGRTGERVWRMPLIPEHVKATRSEIADVQNIGLGRRNAALTTSAAFLSYFVPENLPWAHLDIAGPAILEKTSRPYESKGGSGWGVRLLVDLLEHWR